MDDIKSIIITGCNSGLGEYLSKSFCENGHSVIGIDKNKSNVSEQKDSFKVLKCDLTDEDSTISTFDDICSKNTNITALINNAGFIHNELIINLLDRNSPKHSFKNWEKVIDANLTSTFLSSREVSDYWIKKRIRGNIINISSICALGNVGQSAYSSAKAGIEALTRTLSKELSPFGIRTNCIAPGFFDTTSTKSALSEQKLQQLVDRIPLKRLGQPNEILSAVNFILENQYLNGAIIPLDGGLNL
jgi:3-oxoacyl-[acyl-carrier protein] reductase